MDPIVTLLLLVNVLALLVGVGVGLRVGGWLRTRHLTAPGSGGVLWARGRAWYVVEATTMHKMADARHERREEE